MIFITVSTGHFDPLIQACDQLRNDFEFFGQIGSGSYAPKFPSVKTLPPDALQAKMKEADLVVSHGGTGMLSMLYQLRKPAIVVPKQIRYGEANDGQVELARKWGESGMALLCLDLIQLKEKILQARNFPFRFYQFSPVGISLERDRSLLQMRQEPVGNACVVVDDLCFGETIRRVEHLGQICNAHLAPVDLEFSGCGGH